jgi:hypothetical protein
MTRALIVLATICVLCGVAAFADEKSFSYVDLKEYVNYKPGDTNGDGVRGGFYAESVVQRRPGLPDECRATLALE